MSSISFAKLYLSPEYQVFVLSWERASKFSDGMDLDQESHATLIALKHYPLVNDHIAGWNISSFNRKYIFNPGPFSSQLCLLIPECNLKTFPETSLSSRNSNDLKASGPEKRRHFPSCLGGEGVFAMRPTEPWGVLRGFFQPSKPFKGTKRGWIL